MWIGESLFDCRRFNMGKKSLRLGVTCLSTSQHGMCIELFNLKKKGKRNNRGLWLSRGTHGSTMWMSRNWWLNGSRRWRIIRSWNWRHWVESWVVLRSKGLVKIEIEGELEVEIEGYWADSWVILGTKESVEVEIEGKGINLVWKFRSNGKQVKEGNNVG